MRKGRNGLQYLVHFLVPLNGDNMPLTRTGAPGVLMQFTHCIQALKPPENSIHAILPIHCKMSSPPHFNTYEIGRDYSISDVSVSLAEF